MFENAPFQYTVRSLAKLIETIPLAYSDPMQTVTQAQVRKIALFSQKLHSRHECGKGLDGTLAAIDHLGYVQIDTLAVVERAHSHTLLEPS